ncbi:hypothetical protein T05_1960, partial [Trichinella murrelli]
LGLKTRYRTEEQTKRKIRILLATAFLPVPQDDTGVSLLEAGTTGTLVAFFQYIQHEWMTDESWHNRLNRKAGKSHNGFYELLELLIAEQGVMDTLIQQALPGNMTVGDLRRVYKVYTEKQRQVAQYTGEYTNGRRTLEQFLEALIEIAGQRVTLSLVPFVTRKLKVLLQHSRFFKHIIQYFDITPGRVKSIMDHKAAVLRVNLNPESIICDFEIALIPAIQGYFPNTRVQGSYFHFCQAVHRKVGELGLKTRYRTEEQTKRKIRILLATAFLPVPQDDTGVSLLEAGTTGTLAAFFQYIQQEWMTDESWHNRLNRKAGKSHNGFYELLELLIAEQGVMDTLIQQALPGNVTVGDLRRVNKVYAQKQRQVAQYTGEYTNGRRTLEQFLEALIVKSIIDHKAAVLGVNLNPQTIICDFEALLTSLIQGYLRNTRVHGCYFHFSKAVHRKVGELELNRNRRKNIRMLLATVFLPVPQVDTGVSLLEAGTTGWMTDERLPHWNVRDVSLRTNSHLEGWHNRLNRKADKSHNGFYELLELLIAEQGVMDTLIQHVLSVNVTVGELRRVNKVYAQKQRQFAQYTGEYTNGRRTLEQFLEALMYITPEPI